MPPASLFVSYSSRDRDRVVPLVEQLRKAGLPVWLDQTDIGAGAEWSGEIIAGLDASQVVLVCLSHSSVVSEEVFREVAYAASARKRFLPVRLEPIELPGRLRYFLSAIHFVDLFGSAAEARASALPELLRQLLSSTPPAEPGETALWASAALPPAVPNTLPIPPTRFLGRDQERREVAQLLERARLVTLTGPGGTGKTRLSIAVAADLQSRFPGGTYFVELAPVTDPALVAGEIAQGIGAQEAESGGAAQALRVSLGDRPVLLVLDNLEQVLAAGATLAQLLTHCPHVRILASSRIPLRIYGEQEYAVAPLPLPPVGAVADPAALQEFPAVELFCQRATAVKPAFRLDHGNAAAVLEICRRLEGLPLALELAAARIKLLPPAALLGRLERRLTTLTGGSRDLPARQQTLRGAIGWSHDLLQPEEQVLFRRLAAFRSGCTLEEVTALLEALEPGASDPLDGLASLVDQSLLRQSETPAGDVRFWMYEMIREFGLEQLEAAGERPVVQDALAGCFTALAETAATELWGLQQSYWLDRLEVERDNLRAALEWSREQGNGERLLRLSASLWYYWAVRGYFTEGRAWLEEALHGAAACLDPAATERTLLQRCWALGAAAMLAYFLGEYPRMVALAEECLIWTTGSPLRLNHAFALAVLGVGVYYLGDRARGLAASEEAFTLAREREGDGWVTGFASNVRAILDYLEGSLSPEIWEETHALFERLGDRYWGTYARIGLGFVRQCRGEFAVSLPVFRSALETCRSLSNLRGIGLALAGVAGALGATGDAVRAARLFGASEAVREAIGSPIPRIYREVHEQNVARVRSQLPEAELAAAWQAGRVLNLEAAIREAELSAAAAQGPSS